MKNTLLALTLSGISALSYAETCYQQSPDLISSGDAYYDIDTAAKVDGEARQKLFSIYKKLEGNWSGKVTEMICKGPDRNVQIEYRNYEIDTDIKAGANNSLHLQSNRYWVEERRRQQASRHLFGPDGAYKLLSISDNHIEVSHKYRNATKTGNSIFRESVTRLERTNNGLKVKMSSYVNGILVSTETANARKS